MKFLPLILLVCCTPREKKQPVLVRDSVKELVALNVKEIYKISKSANFFSSLSKKDTFILELRGNYITKSKIKFRIISYQNEVVYEDQFEMMALYGYGPDVTKPTPDSITVERHLVERFENFFSSDSFLKPAIKSDAKYEAIYNSIISEEEWVQIKNDPASIGFGFTLWEESIAYITYSQEKKKAIIYYVCC